MCQSNTVFFLFPYTGGRFSNTSCLVYIESYQVKFQDGITVSQKNKWERDEILFFMVKPQIHVWYNYCTYIWLICMVNIVGKYAIHGSYGNQTLHGVDLSFLRSSRVFGPMPLQTFGYYGGMVGRWGGFAGSCIFQ